MKKTLFYPLVLIIIVGLVFVSFGEIALAEEYELEIGEDRTGNMVADPPENEDDWLDPDTLVFAVAPTEDPAQFQSGYADLIAHLENELARPIQWFNIRNYAAQLEALRAGRLHITGVASGSVPMAVQRTGFVPMIGEGTEEGFRSYKMYVITHLNSGIESMEDLEGREVAFVSETSSSGFFAPRAVLYEQYGLLPDQDYSAVFSGSHENSVMGVYHEDYDVAAVASGPLTRAIERGDVEDDAIVRIFESDPLPPTAWGVQYRLAPDLQEAIKAAFLSFDGEGSSLVEEGVWADVEATDRYVEIDFESDWRIVREIESGSAALEDLVD